VKWVESGEVVRFTYRVLDANKAKVLNDKKLEPSLIDPRAGVSLVVPSMNKLGNCVRAPIPKRVSRIGWLSPTKAGR